MNISMVINQMIVLFLVLVVGYVANKLKIMDTTSNQRISKLVVNITLPAYILSAVAGGDRQLTNSEVWFLLGVAVVLYILLIAFSFIVPPILGVKKEQVGVYRFMTIFSNVGFMGFPVVSALFGDSAVFYAALFNIPYNILVFSLGIYLINKDCGLKITPKLFLNPGIVASVGAMILYLLNISLPKVIVDTTSLIGQITTPATMLLIGSNLAMISLKDVFKDVRLYPFSIIKLVVMPVIFWLIFKNFISNELMLGVTVVISAMPVATNATLICEEYGGDQKMASKGIFLTTLISVITIPLVMYLLFVR